ncbi:MAG: flavodoxin family protein, partial [Thermodesulfobacteriota bacterium]
MKSLIAYSSRTGNTRKVAEAIFHLRPKPKEIHPVGPPPSPDKFDFIAPGFRVHEG